MQNGAIGWANHAVAWTERSKTWLEGASEELPQVSILPQVFDFCLMHVAPEGPRKEAQHWCAKPHRQLYVIGPAPPPRGHAQGQHPVEGHLEARGDGLWTAVFAPSTAA